MSKYVDRVTHTLDFSDELDGIPAEDRPKVLEEIGQYLVEQILENCGRGQTSVANGKWKRSLSPEYAKFKRGQSSSDFANMELTGEMLNALKFEIKRFQVEVGIFNQQEAQKADNHNKFSSASQKTKLPERQFIPRKGENFKRDIQREINQIIQEAVDGSTN